MSENLRMVCRSRVEWFKSLSDADKEKVKVDQEDFKNANTRDARKMEIAYLFQQSDSNQDDLLDKTEFIIFMGKLGLKYD